MPERALLRARPGEARDAAAVAELLYATATGMYDVYSGSREGALRVLRAAYARPGSNASREVVTVADADGAAIGAMAAFPFVEARERARRFVRLTLARSAPWRWRGILRVDRLGEELTPVPPADSLYVDALATAPAHRRRGVATALLACAAASAHSRGLSTVALETATTNAAARALYAAAGFDETGRTRPRGDIPGIVGYALAV